MEVYLLPIFKKKDAAVSGLLIKQRVSDEKPEEDQDDKSSAIHACAQELIRAVHAHDIKATAEAMADAFEILESEPHEEGEHTNASPHTYEAQNRKAGEQD